MSANTHTCTFVFCRVLGVEGHETTSKTMHHELRRYSKKGNAVCWLTSCFRPSVSVRTEQDCTTVLVRVIQRIHNKDSLIPKFGTMYYTVQRVWSLIKFLNTFQVARVMSIHELRFGCETKTRLKKMDRSNNNFCNHHSVCTDSIVCQEVRSLYLHITVYYNELQSERSTSRSMVVPRVCLPGWHRFLVEIIHTGMISKRL